MHASPEIKKKERTESDNDVRVDQSDLFQQYRHVKLQLFGRGGPVVRWSSSDDVAARFSPAQNTWERSALVKRPADCAATFVQPAVSNHGKNTTSLVSGVYEPASRFSAPKDIYRERTIVLCLRRRSYGTVLPKLLMYEVNFY